MLIVHRHEPDPQRQLRAILLLLQMGGSGHTQTPAVVTTNATQAVVDGAAGDRDNTRAQRRPVEAA